MSTTPLRGLLPLSSLSSTAARTGPHTVRAVVRQARVLPAPEPVDSVGGEPWRVLAAPDVVVLRDPSVADLRRVPSGRRVALVTDRPLARRATRSLAEAGGVVVERELLLLPTSRSPLVVLDDDPESVRLFWQGLATVPPGVRRTALPTLMLALARRTPWWLTGAVVPGRLLLGRRIGGTQ